VVELRDLRAHLEGCERCREYRRWLSEAVPVVPQSLSPMEPPAGLRERLLDAARADLRHEPAPSRRRFLPSLRVSPGFAAAAASVLLTAALAGYLVGHGSGGPETQTIQANSSIPGSPARGSLVRTGDTALVRISELPRLRPRRVYQLWVRRDEDVRPSSIFVVNRDGRASAAIPSGVAGADEVMVSEEPDGGSRQPTSEPVLKLRLR
jgi:hypothetical protein